LSSSFTVFEASPILPPILARFSLTPPALAFLKCPTISEFPHLSLFLCVFLETQIFPICLSSADSFQFAFGFRKLPLCRHMIS